MLAIATITLFFVTLGNAQISPYTHFRYGSPTSYTSFYAGANPVGYSTTKERINILMKDIEGYIDSFGDTETSARFKAAIPSIVAYVENSIAQAANTPGAAAVQPVSDADFAAYREKQNKIFATSGDLSALLSNLKFF